MTIGKEIYNMNHADFYSKIHFFMHMCVKLPFPQDNINCTSPKYKTVSACQDMQRKWGEFYRINYSIYISLSRSLEAPFF